MTVTEIDQAAQRLIERFESFSAHPEWPGYSSGVTLGFGSDIGANPDALALWEGILKPSDMLRLKDVSGITGPAARDAAKRVSDIAIPRDGAERVFRAELDYSAKLVARRFLGSDKLPPKSFGALVSLAYNISLDGKAREEVRNIARMTPFPAYWADIPLEIADMSAHWDDPVRGPTASNLMGRRYAEAHLFADGLRDAGLAFKGALLLGDRSDDVILAQARLNLHADGIFGPATLRSVLAWQELEGRPKTGLLDQAALKALGI